ncbi:MAG: NCS2 family permease, partial [Pseudomonadales bacterium]
MADFLLRRFELQAHGTDLRTEIVAGTTTFLTMAYIAFVNPAILQDAGMDFGAVFVATCLASAFGTLMMGLYANYPIALAPGMGLNAFFTYGVVIGLDYPWQVALGAVFLSGVLFVILSVLPVREWLINAIPQTMKLAISAGIGLFLAIIALRNAGVIVAHPETLVATGNLMAPEPLLALLGFTAIIALHARGVPGAVVIGILGVTAIGIAFDVSAWKGFASLPPDPTPTLFALDIPGALEVGLIAVILTFLIVDIFDTAGTLIGVAHQARLLDAQGNLPRLNRALLADSTATIFGALAGSSPVTSYIESAAGTNAGGRTGLTAVVVAALFILCLFLSPLAQSVP